MMIYGLVLMNDKFIKISKSKEGSEITLYLLGKWLLEDVAEIERTLKNLDILANTKIIIDGKNLEEIDTSGAWLLIKFFRALLQQKINLKRTDFQAPHAKILEIIEHIEHPDSIQIKGFGAIGNYFRNVGAATSSFIKEFYILVAFFGQICTTFATSVIHPSRFRLRSIVYHVNEIGIKAVPIVSLMAFLISIVTGYQGAHQLQKFNANIFTIDLIAISVLREMGILITAIIVVGRSGSAFAAQIGVMKVNEEVDAMRTIGLDPFEMLVLPRLLAILIALPALALIADIVGLLGGLFVSSNMLDLSPLQYIERLKEAVTVTTLWVGLVKAPVFAVLIGMVGCSHGLQVRGSAEQVGEHTTASVVQSIFLVLMADAIFSVIFTIMGI